MYLAVGRPSPRFREQRSGRWLAHELDSLEISVYVAATFREGKEREGKGKTPKHCRVVSGMAGRNCFFHVLLVFVDQNVSTELDCAMSVSGWTDN